MKIAWSRSVSRNALSSVLLALLVAGCAIDVPTNPDTFNVEPANAAHLRGPQAVALRNAYQAEAKRALGAGKGQTWTVAQKPLTDTAIAMLTRALEKQGIKADAAARKSISLQVRVEHGSIRTIAFSPVA